MIRYSLICGEKHRFDSWFASADAFETLRTSRLVSCAVCGSTSVEKAIMAPSVQTAESKPAKPREADPAPEATPPAERPLASPGSPAEQALAELRQKIEANSDYVGSDFAREARAMHLGETPRRSIHGEANAKDAKGLIEDGIPVLPLPFMPRRKTN
ncbi:DUF1178 family protein [Tropicimonas sediminicola]|uniref:DUF1178 family protein n=1 Tax=Tropicimonas sediminicola TaxID=1031541 RepID=A0A239LSI2_9RHOB|nr:DUF1178 family protein [Tropicimonas sediminicola]SNT33401.1 hypothetical protein SAMN05421757_11115 [Tropicimonas sediminicola]